MIEVKPNKIVLNSNCLKAVEKEYGYIFPLEYIDFLKRYNGGRPQNNIVKLENQEVKSFSITTFFGMGLNSTDDIISLINIFDGRIPKGCVPIASAEGGNIICINLNKDMYGRIYFWNHEKEILFELNEITIEDLIYLAESFNEFISIIDPYNPEDEDLSGYKVKSVWVDPDFLKELDNQDS